MTPPAKPLRIAGIFGPTIQGKGALIGLPTVFGRAGGCDYRCVWLLFAACGGQCLSRQMGRDGGGAGLGAGARSVGGTAADGVDLGRENPAIQDFGPLIALGRAEGYDFALETQGSVARDWFSDLAMLVLGPKPPSSGHRPDWDAFDVCLAAGRGAGSVVIKIVVFDEGDYAWARDVADRYPGRPLVLQPGNPAVDPDLPVAAQDVADRLLWLVEKVTADGRFRPRLLPQLHVLLWGNRGCV